MAKLSVLGAAALCLGLSVAASASLAQQAFDPMRPAINLMMPADPMGSPESDSPDAAPNPELGNLPDAPGAEETYYQCVACHSTAIIRQQHLSDARWDYLWTWMVEEQGMYEPDDETREIILNYLKTHFSSERRPTDPLPEED